MFPVLPFPSKNPRRSDNLMQEYHEFFTDHHLTSAQNFTYADEQNPFELYRKIPSYEIDDATEFEKLNKDSEPFLLWITGEAYNED